MIKIEGLKKSFDGNVIFHDVNLEINKGDSVVIIGGSGCGKSTLLRCINRLIEPDEGAIYFNDVNILKDDTNLNQYRQKVGMVYQQFNLFSHLNVLENCILTPVKVLKMPMDKAIEKAERLLKLVGMDTRKYHMPSELSGGQKQRVSIARTLMMDPDVILFDEPTSALDPTMVDEVENVIKDLIKEGLTCVIVTHEMRFAKSVSNKVVFLAEKGIYEMGSPEEIFDHPSKPLTRQFIYRSRLKEIEVNKNDFDIYSSTSEIIKVLMPYGLNKKQSNAVSYLLDELIYPLINSDSINSIRLIVGASETGVGHKIFVETDDINENLLLREEIDQMGLKILENQVVSIKDTLDENSKHILNIEI